MAALDVVPPSEAGGEVSWLQAGGAMEIEQSERIREIATSLNLDDQRIL